MNLTHAHCTYWQSQQWKNHHVQRPHRTLGTSGQLGRCDGGQKGEPRQAAVQPPWGGPGGGGPAGGLFHVPVHLRREHHQQLCPPGAARCDRQHCGRHQLEPLPLLHHPAVGTGHSRGGGSEQAGLNEKKGTNIDVPALSRALNCPVVETVSTSQKGLAQVIQAAATGYIVKKKKSGAHCIGCPDGGSCSHCQGGGSCHCHK